ncbi:CfaE/CblD family pilus tip adhesin, partial [Yersinia enterocolitica]
MWSSRGHCREGDLQGIWGSSVTPRAILHSVPVPPSLLIGWMGGANVKLRFTNLKTKATVDLTVTGEWRAPRCVYSLPFSNGFTGFTGVVSACPWGTVFFEARLPETELRKLPYGGVWDAQMRLKTMEWAVDTPIGDVVTDIRLNVRSEASIS